MKPKPIQAKVMFVRIKEYLTMLNIMMVGYLFVTNAGFNIIFIATIIGIACVAFAIIDYKWILPKEQKQWSEKNPIIMEILERLKRIENDRRKNL